MFTVEKDDAAGYVLVLEDGVVIARCKAHKQAKRIVAAFQALQEVVRCYLEDWGSNYDACSCFMETIHRGLGGPAD